MTHHDRGWRLVERGCAIWSCGQSVARRVRWCWSALLGKVRRWMLRLRAHASSTFSEGFVVGLSWCADLAVWSCGESVGRADCRCVSLLGGCRCLSVRSGAHAASTVNERVVVGTRRGAGLVVWSCGESAGRAGCRRASPVGVRRWVLACLGVHTLVPVVSERVVVGTWRGAGLVVWSCGESTHPIGCLLVLPAEVRRWVLAGQGSHAASMRGERSVTVTSRRSGWAVWSCGESAERAASQGDGWLRACRWWATLLGAPADRDCRLWKGRSFTANGHELCGLVTFSTRSDGGAA